MAVKLIPVGPDVPVGLAAVMKSHEDAIRALQQPGAPQPAYSTTRADLLRQAPAANFPQCVALVSDLGVLAASNGTVWINQATGAPI